MDTRCCKCIRDRQEQCDSQFNVKCTRCNIRGELRHHQHQMADFMAKLWVETSVSPESSLTTDRSNGTQRDDGASSLGRSSSSKRSSEERDSNSRHVDIYYGSQPDTSGPSRHSNEDNNTSRKRCRSNSLARHPTPRLQQRKWDIDASRKRQLRQAAQDMHKDPNHRHPSFHSGEERKFYNNYLENHELYGSQAWNKANERNSGSYPMGPPAAPKRPRTANAADSDLQARVDALEQENENLKATLAQQQNIVMENGNRYSSRCRSGARTTSTFTTPRGRSTANSQRQ